MNALDIAENLLHDTADIWYTSVWETFVGYGILSVLALMVSVGVGYCIKKFFYSEKKISEKEKACARVQFLALNGSFYVQLIKCLKYYLALYAYIPTQTLTENELKIVLEKTGNRQLINLLMPVLEHACAAKFTQHSFCRQTGEQDRQRVLAALELIIKSY